MNGVTAMLVVLGLSGAARAPDLEVEARTASGASHPELAEAVARALVAGGARVVLKAPASPPCQYCAKVAVVESGRDGLCKIEVSQDRHRATAVLRLPTSSPMLDRARAIAVQARLLVTWEVSPEPRLRETRSPTRKSDSVTVEPTSAVAELPVESAPLPPAPPVPVPPPSEALPPERPPAAPAPAPPRPTTAAVAGASRPAPAAPTMRPSARPSEPKPPEPRPRLQPEAASAEAARGAVRREERAAAPAELPTTPATARSRWPWIPTAIGAGAAVAAMVCAGLARDRYDALADRSRPYASAQSIKTEGERWQIASFVLAGAAAVGVGTGLVGFATRGPVTAAATPLPGGGMVALRGELP